MVGTDYLMLMDMSKGNIVELFNDRGMDAVKSSHVLELRTGTLGIPVP